VQVMDAPREQRVNGYVFSQANTTFYITCLLMFL